MYTSGDGVPQDYAEAVRWYRLAAEQGSAVAQSHLGFMYAVGDGVPKDLVYSYMWLDLSAAHGNARARSGQGVIMEQMSREQIAEAQRLSRKWIEEHR
jgi:TPR repeat protein